MSLTYVAPMISPKTPGQYRFGKAGAVIAVAVASALLAGACAAAVPPDPAPAGAATPAGPTEPVAQGAYGDWSLFDFQENGGPVCYLASRPLKSSASVPGRKGSYMLITNRPAEGKAGVVSIVSGYTFQAGSTVTVAIGKRQFHLFTDSDTAWAEDSDDSLIVAAMHGGTTLSVTGKTSDGTVVTDGFGLKDMVQALAALDKDCPVPGKVLAKPVQKKKRKKPS